MRVGEAVRLRWTGVDLKRRIIVMNEPEKGGNARIFKVSEKLTRMLEAMPSKCERVFGKSNARRKYNTFYNTRKFAAKKFGNPRLMRIHFHTLRHWKATMEYHKTKDLLYVMQLLGHKGRYNPPIHPARKGTLHRRRTRRLHRQSRQNTGRHKGSTRGWVRLRLRNGRPDVL